MPVFLDHNATAPVAPSVLRAMEPLLREGWGNASSRHARGRRALVVVEAAREQVAALVGSEPDEVIFCSGGTEANNLALRGLMGTQEGPGRLVVGAIEHPSVAEVAARLEADGHSVARIAPRADGRVPAEGFRAAAPGARLLSLMLANNETGVLQPVAELGSIGVPVHCDAVQAVGRVPVGFAALGLTSLSISSHKIHGPQGVGALVLKRGTPIRPVLVGGGQERGLRPGTYNLAAIAGFGEAARLARVEQATRAGYVDDLRQRLEEGLRRKLPQAVVVGAGAPRLPNTCMVCFPGQDAAALAGNLDTRGFELSTGSACTSEDHGPSEVLLAMGLPRELAGGALRISLGPDNQPAEIDALIEALVDLTGQRRGLVGRILGRVARREESA